MVTKIPALSTAPFATSEREHQGFRLNGPTVAIIEDIAMGVEAGEGGLKSCALGASAAGEAGAKGPEVNVRHHAEIQVIEDEDECFNAIGDLLAAGFSEEEIAKRIALGGGATHLLALESYCDRIRLRCRKDTPAATPLASRRWQASKLHEDRQRCHRTMATLRREPDGHSHVAVLHIVYGWADPFVGTLPAEVRVALGREFAPLARYTDAVEAKRVELVKVETTEAATRKWVAAPTKDPGRAWRGVDMSTDKIDRAAICRDAEGRLRVGDTRVQSGSEGARAALSLGLRAEQKNAGVVDLARYRAKSEWYDRLLTSGDGLRYAVAPFAEPMPVHGEGENPAHWEARKEERKARRLEHEARIDAFISAVKRDANRMLTAASEAFRDAWQAS